MNQKNKVKEICQNIEHKDIEKELSMEMTHTSY